MRLPVLIGLHLLVSAVAAAVLAQQFWHNPRVVVAHILLLAEWDFLLLSVVGALAARSSRPGIWPGRTFEGPHPNRPSPGRIAAGSVISAGFTRQGCQNIDRKLEVVLAAWAP